MNLTNATKLKTAMFLGIAGILMILKPAPCLAQAEVNPDHYEITNEGPAPQATQATVGGGRVHNASGLSRGASALNYAGLTVSPAPNRDLSVAKKSNAVSAALSHGDKESSASRTLHPKKTRDLNSAPEAD